MSNHTRMLEIHAASPRCLAMESAACAPVYFYFGYWFSHWRA